MAGQVDKSITRVLHAAQAGNQQAAEELLPLLYEELRRLARARMRKTPPGHTLQPTALVHEAYLQLIGSADADWRDRKHFFGAAAQAMRNILVDQARRKASLKRGGDRKRRDIEDVTPVIEQPSDDMMALDEALQRLEQDDPRKGEIVNLRYFAGLTNEETASAMGISVGTVKREWRYIKHWLYAQLEDQTRSPAGPRHDDR